MPCSQSPEPAFPINPHPSLKQRSEASILGA